MRKILKLKFKTEIDGLTNDIEKQVTLCFDAAAIRNGFISKVGAENFAILTAILSYMNENGECCPTLEQIAKVAGLTSRTVIKRVQELEALEIDGKKVIERKLVGDGNKKHSEYKMTVDEATETVKKFNSRDAIHYFMERYKEVYKVAYNPSWVKDGSIVKNKLVNVYTEEQIKAIIDIGVTEYEERWSSSKYPRPTLYSICGWLGNAALTVMQDKQKEEERMNTGNSIEAELKLSEKYF